MTIEVTRGATIITGEEDIEKFRLLALRGALKVEVQCPGLVLSHRRTANKIARDFLRDKGIKPVGNKKADTLRAFETWLRNQGILRETNDG